MENQEQNQNVAVETEQTNQPVEAEAKPVEKTEEVVKEVKTEKMFSQEELNKILTERLAKEHKKSERAKMSEQELTASLQKEKEEELEAYKQKVSQYETEMSNMQVNSNLLSVGLDTTQIENIKTIAGGNLTHLKEKSIDELKELFSSMLNKPQQVQTQVVFEKEQPKKVEKEEKPNFWEAFKQDFSKSKI